ncbi:M14 family metallopeptidase [Asticcacaulis sp. 201]|uniref:succinylglutamate desuccinylase/aspartoacylase family protein n=1 Tax=Asticcacaulis sp. 201 TaxID=3028787 RepID=UPI00291708BF|nr:M14 family metallopeptidase [Asticcacaulis sp. 201]MDV6331782.1 M14 family metallopeptidase [Asticcacaulis sp. 201]
MARSHFFTGLAGLLLFTSLPLVTATPTLAATVYTGDRLDDAAVIDKLDVADLPAGQVTKLWFRVTDNAIGQGWYVPVVVVKGAKPGPKMLITSGIHGDELNGISVVQRLAQTLDPKTLSGTLVAVPGLNTPGLMHSTRGFTSDEIGTNGENLNRIMPGNADNGGPASRFAGRLWSNIFVGNADFAIDLHTQSRGGAYPGYVFAQTAEARQIADWLRPDVIGMDAGIEGTVENMLNPAGIPAVTYELGAPEKFDTPMIERALRGIRNVMIGKGMLAGKADLSDPAPFVGNVVTDLASPRGGWAEIKVKLGDDVKPGQAVAIIRNPFGEAIATVTAKTAGHVLSVNTDPRTEPGDMVVRLIAWSDSGVCSQAGCPDTSHK